ncbi:hypothetical protein ACROYT_G021555 [Oculina patagonica]
MTKHLQENSEEHLQLALEVIKQQRTEMGIQRGRLRKQEENITQLMESVSKLTALCEETLKSNAEQEKTINRLSEQVKEQKKHQSKHEKELRQRITELEKRGPKNAPKRPFKRDDVRRKGIDRPGRDERAIIVGFDDFIKHEELEAGNFLVDDTLFIRVLVDMPES